MADKKKTLSLELIKYLVTLDDYIFIHSSNLTELEEEYIVSIHRLVDDLTPNTRVFNGSTDILTFFKARKYLRQPTADQDVHLRCKCYNFMHYFLKKHFNRDIYTPSQN